MAAISSTPEYRAAISPGSITGKTIDHLQPGKMYSTGKYITGIPIEAGIACMHNPEGISMSAVAAAYLPLYFA